MKNTTRIAVIGLIVLFFVSTTGVAVYQHYCAHDGVFSSLFVEVSHECEKEAKHLEQHACCQMGEVEKSEADKMFSENCCIEEVVIYQINSDLITQHTLLDLTLIPAILEDFNPLILPFSPLEEELPKVNSPPFVPIVQMRLAQLQRYLL